MDVKHISELVFLIPKPFSGVGGIERIVITLAQEFIGKNLDGICFHAIVPKNSYTENELKKLNSRQIKISHIDQGRVCLESTSLLVGWGGVGNLLKSISGNPLYIVWSIFPGSPLSHLNVENRSFLMKWLALKKQKVSGYLAKSSTLYFMDSPNLLEFNRLSSSIAPKQFLPIPIAVEKNLFILNKRISTSLPNLNVSYVARGKVPWKVYPFVSFIRDLVRHSIQPTIKIFTDDSELFKNIFKKIDLELQIEYIYGVSGESLRNNLADWSDLHIGMGTAVLEGGAIGIPSICIDYAESLTDLPSWTWLYQNSSFDLGQLHPNHFQSTLEIKSLFSTDDQIEKMSNQTFDYVSRNHSAEKVLNELLGIDAIFHLSDYLSAHGLLITLAHKFFIWFKRET